MKLRRNRFVWSMWFSWIPLNPSNFKQDYSLCTFYNLLIFFCFQVFCIFPYLLAPLLSSERNDGWVLLFFRLWMLRNCCDEEDKMICKCCATAMRTCQCTNNFCPIMAWSCFGTILDRLRTCFTVKNITQQETNFRTGSWQLFYYAC